MVNCYDIRHRELLMLVELRTLKEVYTQCCQYLDHMKKSKKKFRIFFKFFFNLKFLYFFLFNLKIYEIAKKFSIKKFNWQP